MFSSKKFWPRRRLTKKNADKENADDISLKAMESLKETQKRKADCGEDKSGEVMDQR